MSRPLLQVALDAGYREHTTLRDVRFELSAGERLGLLGASGTGKSTLMLALLNLLPRRGGWVKGEILLNGQSILSLSQSAVRSLRGREIALVPQSSTAALNPALTLRRHFEHAWRAHRASDPPQLARRIAELFQRVALPCDAAFLERKPQQISVGQAQRCTLALALLHGPKVILADEPTSALDPLTQREVTQLLEEVCTETGSALLFVSHDLLSVFHLCTHVAVMADGTIQECVALQDLPRARDPWLHQLLATLPFTPNAYPTRSAGSNLVAQ